MPWKENAGANAFERLLSQMKEPSVVDIALLSIGIIIGSTWPELFKARTFFLFLLFLISASYVTYVWLKQ